MVQLQWLNGRWLNSIRMTAASIGWILVIIVLWHNRLWHGNEVLLITFIVNGVLDLIMAFVAHRVLTKRRHELIEPDDMRDRHTKAVLRFTNAIPTEPGGYDNLVWRLNSLPQYLTSGWYPWAYNPYDHSVELALDVGADVDGALETARKAVSLYAKTFRWRSFHVLIVDGVSVTAA